MSIRRIEELRRRRYYGRDAKDKAGILRYTKVIDPLIDMEDIPAPANERELAWLLSFCWHVDQAYGSLPELAAHRSEGQLPGTDIQKALARKHQAGLAQGLQLAPETRSFLSDLGIAED